MTVTAGLGFTVTVPAIVLEQPDVEPVTVYDVVTLGETIKVLFVLPVFHAYKVAPEAVSVVDCPVHIVAEFTVTVGFGLTLTVAIAVLEHPDVVPVTV